MIELLDTNSSKIAAEFLRARTRAGSPAMGMVMTLVIVVDEDDAEDAMRVAREAAHEHPARVLGVILGDARGAGVVNAQVGTGSGWTGETALIRLKGEVVKHPESVVLPLLLPDSPVAAWWPTDPPEDPAADPLGRLAQRRITDAAGATKARTKAIHVQCARYTRGNTDLAWTRITPWRALLAAALDQHPLKVTGASVAGEKVSPSADLLVAWLAHRLRIPVERTTTAGPGITEVVLETAAGPIRISRADGKNATFATPGRPDRPIALKRRDLPQLLAEELRRLDEDDVYAATARYLAQQDQQTAPTRKKASS
ncbi:MULTISPECIES: glucose-6-phosphate dehydrogenase assembly protein OpcA [unclassified Nocardioides]|uniref:glucose-6-phosphate dehydrogenase assembly protein OpcA n=1 Tax=unclassified Nocardioides TaxID=2615069 RepID=UPI0030153A9C